jgi:hypothetical protein
VLHQRISRRWPDELVVVAATGPSLTQEQADLCRGHRVVAVNDAYKLFPFADVLYACDGVWWKHHKGCPEFAGEKWSSHGKTRCNDKREVAEKFGLELVHGQDGRGFSFDPERIHYAGNSGFQAVNLALLFGGNPIVLVGFDMRTRGKQRHFFGDHQGGLSNSGDPARWVRHYEVAAGRLPEHVRVINATPGSAVKCFPMMELSEALKYGRDITRGEGARAA